MNDEWKNESIFALPINSSLIVQHSALIIPGLALVGLERRHVQIIRPPTFGAPETDRILEDIHLPHAKRRLMSGEAVSETVRGLIPSVHPLGDSARGWRVSGEGTHRQSMKHVAGGAGQENLLRKG
jgi:hypothetical protein